VALGAGGLGYNILQGQKQTKNQDALAADASTATANSKQMVASGEDLQKYLTNGTLPPQYQQQVQQAINSAKATAISNAAAQGDYGRASAMLQHAQVQSALNTLGPNTQAQGYVYGLYSCRGTCQCGTSTYSAPGSNGHEMADVDWMVAQGADYLKIDSAYLLLWMLLVYFTTHAL
jgi:hypothetical protein